VQQERQHHDEKKTMTLKKKSELTASPSLYDMSSGHIKMATLLPKMTTRRELTFLKVSSRMQNLQELSPSPIPQPQIEIAKQQDSTKKVGKTFQSQASEQLLSSCVLLCRALQ
jgi:hypothetical protein